MTDPGGYRFEELGWLQFQQLCTEVLADAGLPREAWHGDADRLRAARLPDDVAPALGWSRAREVIVLWLTEKRERPYLRDWLREALAPVLVISNRALPELDVDPGVVRIGPGQLTAAVDARPHVRRRVPFVLGIRPLEQIAEPGVLERSTLDVGAARSLARVFVPTRAYHRALDVLEAHSFAVLSGPPEMGKTAAARTIALAGLAAGWEAHECTRPEQLWEAYRRDRPQIFIADDAFGSTEYNPSAAERWAVDLDRILRALDGTHHLIWTSRPGPLRAALRRIQREHGVERWPKPAEVQVDASALDVEEKTLILFRHAQAARLSSGAVGVVRLHAQTIVGNDHFTPERIRRFVGRRLLEFADREPGLVHEAIQWELREPTAAMATSLDTLAPDLRTVLVALVDCQPGLVAQRDLAAAVRRHGDGGLARPVPELVDLLADHFVRVTPPDRVTWVHPSWRDLVIERIAGDVEARRRFVERCSVDGLLLALSTGGGAAGERALPLLVEDADWDAVGARLHDLTPGLDDHDALRLLLALGEALVYALGTDRAEVAALAGSVLTRLRSIWDAAHAPMPVALVVEWFAVAARLRERPEPPDLTATWIESLPTNAATLRDRDDLRRLDDWLTLVELLQVRDPEALQRFGFPDGQGPAARNLARSGRQLALEPIDDLLREHLSRTLSRLSRACPSAGQEAHVARSEIGEAGPWVDWWEPDLGEPDAAAEESLPSIVARIMRDLHAN
ncbi:MAG: nSTAND3 domain-containing NTPase [Gaiellaceae bacterium]